MVGENSVTVIFVFLKHRIQKKIDLTFIKTYRLSYILRISQNKTIL